MRKHKNKKLNGLNLHFYDNRSVAQSFQVEYTVRLYRLCLQDDLYDTLENLNITLKYNTLLKPNEEFFFDNLAIGQLYIIEVIPKLNSKKLSDNCSTKCPIFEDTNATNMKTYSCEVCKKMILVFHNTEDVSQKLNTTNQQKCFEYNYQNNINICSDFRDFDILKVLILPNDTPLVCKTNTVSPRKYHVCSMEKKMIDYIEIPYRTIFVIVFPSLIIFVVFIILLLLFNYSLQLYSK